MKIKTIKLEDESLVLLKIQPTLHQKDLWEQVELDLIPSNKYFNIETNFKLNNGLPDPKYWTRKLVTGIAEALIGERPVYQLIKWVSFEVYQEIEKQSKQRSGMNSQRIRPIIRSVRIELTNDKVIEATAVIQKGKRGRGMGLRLEAESDRWRCTELLVA